MNPLVFPVMSFTFSDSVQDQTQHLASVSLVSSNLSDLFISSIIFMLAMNGQFIL